MNESDQPVHPARRTIVARSRVNRGRITVLYKSAKRHFADDRALYCTLQYRRDERRTMIAHVDALTSRRGVLAPPRGGERAVHTVLRCLSERMGHRRLGHAQHRTVRMTLPPRPLPLRSVPPHPVPQAVEDSKARAARRSRACQKNFKLVSAVQNLSYLIHICWKTGCWRSVALFRICDKPIKIYLNSVECLFALIQYGLECAAQTAQKNRDEGLDRG